MRHNKLAGTRFLLGSRKHKPSTFTSPDDTTDYNCGVAGNNNMLHSKSTYFYRWFSEHLGLVVSGLSTKNANKASKISKTNKASKASYLVPAVCGAALLGILGFIVNPAAGKTEAVYAATDDDKCKTSEDPNTGVCAMELGIFMNGTDSAFDELPATELSTDSVVHRDYSFSIRAVDTKDGYDLYAGVVNTGSFGNSLVNADYPTEEYMIKAISGTDVAYSNIGNNEWGYALTSTNQTAEELNYNSLPATTITMENNQTILTSGKLIAHGEDTGYDPSQPVGEDKHTDQDYKLYFAAKASPESPSGHYRTQVMLSLVANPKKVIAGLGGITKMSEMTSTYCKSLPSVTADVTKVPTGQLVDDREGEDGTKYWVAKLADGNCWMTQNMAYDTGAKTTEFKNKVVDPTKSGNEAVLDIGSRSPSNNAYDDAVYPAADTYNAHYRIGNYYNYNNAQTVCTSLNGNWSMPSAYHFDNVLTTKYGITGATNSRAKITPLFIVYGGYTGQYNDTRVSNVGEVGEYWTSTTVGYSDGSVGYRYLNIWGSVLGTTTPKSETGSGLSVRCVVSGE